MSNHNKIFWNDKNRNDYYERACEAAGLKPEHLSDPLQQMIYWAIEHFEVEPGDLYGPYNQLNNDIKCLRKALDVLNVRIPTEA